MKEFTKNVNFQWSRPHDDPFKVLKKTLCSTAVLRHIDAKLSIYLTTDASQCTIGAVLEHEESRSRRTVASASRIPNEAEENFAAHDRELLATICSLKWWRSYIYGNSITVHSDHYPLKYLKTQEN